MRWLYPGWLAVWPLLAAVAVLAWRDRVRRGGLAFGAGTVLTALRPTLTARLKPLPLILRLLALFCLGAALVRPQALMGEDEVPLKGVNIMLVTDLSGSMVADDLKPDRLAAAKNVLKNFVAGIRHDQVGLVVFGAKSFTQVPLTMDTEVLQSAIASMDLNTVDADGTAVGDSILTAVNRLSAFDGQTNVMVLATDGTNNQGEDPLKAAEVAAAKRIRIYTVGIGAQGGAPVYTVDAFGAKKPFLLNGKPMRWDEPNDKVMDDIAQKTGGRYFRATDEKSLASVYAEIDRLIKDEKKRRDPHYRELYGWLVLAALGLLAAEALLSATWLRSLP